jgi:hypothetical protein
MSGSTPLGYYLVYCPTVVLASCYKSLRGLGHNHDEAKRLHKEKERKVIKVETL